MLQARNVPLQDVNDIRDQAEAEASDSEYARGVLETLLWLNGDAGMPFGREPERFHPNDRPEGGPVEGTATSYGPDEDEEE